MEEGASDARGDGDEISLAAEDFHLAGAREFREINGTSTADSSDGGFVGSNAWKAGKEFARVDGEIVERF